MATPTPNVHEIIAHQANLESLWAMHPTTINEALLQAALRHLHAAIEGDEASAQEAKGRYWNVEDEM
jgi:hypothetical protein